ncbi:MAG: transmembrane 220 family protein [Saprospiraceae bacterium]|nr:transmembrane 220 family protein [Saprospiraceae bacterium]
MKIFFLVLGFIFISFAVLQYNDPDPYIWAPYYLLIAAICFLEYKGRYYNLFVGLTFLGSWIWAAFYVPDLLAWLTHGMPNIADQMKAETPYVENMREFLGLLLCSITIGSIMYRNIKS